MILQQPWPAGDVLHLHFLCHGRLLSTAYQATSMMQHASWRGSEYRVHLHIILCAGLRSQLACYSVGAAQLTVRSSLS